MQNLKTIWMFSVVLNIYFRLSGMDTRNRVLDAYIQANRGAGAGQLGRAAVYLNVLTNDLAGIAGPAMVLGLGLGKSDLPSPFAAGEEILVRLVHVEDRGLQGCGIHLPRPGEGFTALLITDEQKRRWILACVRTHLKPPALAVG